MNKGVSTVISECRSMSLSLSPEVEENRPSLATNEKGGTYLKEQTVSDAWTPPPVTPASLIYD